ncbi:MAG: hypothetical protein ACJAR3_002589 [Roseivirga sp.]|jgi:hypothetical protein
MHVDKVIGDMQELIACFLISYYVTKECKMVEDQLGAEEQFKE